MKAATAPFRLLLVVATRGLAASLAAYRPNFLGARSRKAAEADPDDSFTPAGDPNCLAASDSDAMLRSLSSRVSDLQEGIGKRYVCRTQLGFLNVHETPEDPFDTENIVNQLVEGDIVTSTGPPSGDWIQHDGGGWSVSIYNGFTWLEELEK